MWAFTYFLWLADCYQDRFVLTADKINLHKAELKPICRHKHHTLMNPQLWTSPWHGYTQKVLFFYTLSADIKQDRFPFDELLVAESHILLCIDKFCTKLHTHLYRQTMFMTRKEYCQGRRSTVPCSIHSPWWRVLRWKTSSPKKVHPFW